MISTLSKQGGRRYSQMGNSSTVYVGTLYSRAGAAPTPLVIYKYLDVMTGKILVLVPL